MDFPLAPLNLEQFHTVPAGTVTGSLQPFRVCLYSDTLMVLRKIVVTMYADRTLHALFAGIIILPVDG
jgi:hypothetical protein